MVIGRLSVMAGARTRLFEGPQPGRDEAQRKLFAAVGDFLAEHRLAPTPANYSVAYAVVTGSDDYIVRAVDGATYGGVRLSQADADAILAQAGTAAPGPAAVSDVSSSIADLVRAIDDARVPVRSLRRHRPIVRARMLRLMATRWRARRRR